MDERTKHVIGHHGHTTTDRLGMHPEMEEAPAKFDRLMLMVLLPMLAAACFTGWAVAEAEGVARWADRFALAPSGFLFLAMFLVIALKRGVAASRYVTLALSAVNVLVWHAQIMWDLTTIGFSTDLYFDISPWLILCSALFIFFLRSRWGWVLAFAIYALSAIMVVTCLAVTPYTLPPFVLNELGVNYLIAHPVFLVLLMMFINLRTRFVRAQTHAEDLRKLAMQDGLTGLQNRRAFRVSFKRAKSRQLRHKTPLSVILLDIDHFKRVNDTYGHQVGDDILVALSAVLMRGLRGTDEVFRWGGEEFMMLLQETDLKGAVEVAERLRVAIESENLLEKSTITSSFGVTEILPEEGEDVAYPRADEALYVAKRDGRNRVECAASPLAQPAGQAT